jgi:hypothetical protein
MKKKRAMKNEPKKGSASMEEPAHRIRLPGWLVKEEVGLGDVVKRVTYRAGIQPCAGCEKRAAGLNRWVSFSRR